ncbi:MAG: hypothetical protein ACYDBH_21230 [Acidobacteriaceae bacterium]
MWWEISQFRNDIENLEALLFEIATHGAELRSFGLWYVLRKTNFEEVRSVFEEFSANLAICLRVAPTIDKSIFERLNSLLRETNIENIVTQLSVRIKIAEREKSGPTARAIAVYNYIFRRLFLKSGATSLFTDETILLENVLASLSRLRTLVKSLGEEHYRRTTNDDEIFKPSNIDINLIVVKIDAAIANLNTSSDIGILEKDRLVAYLNEAKAELAQEAPAWKKVIGALMICSTLLSGVAATPQAIDNLNSAIKHILGTSVEKIMPNLLPAPRAPKEEDGDKRLTLIT